MKTWYRNPSEAHGFTKHVEIPDTHWYTINPDEPNVIRPGNDYGGEIFLINKVAEGIVEQESFTGYGLSRRASRPMFIPVIIAKDEEIPEAMSTTKTVHSLARGKQYSVYISFADINEAALYKLVFPTNFGFDYDGGV